MDKNVIDEVKDILEDDQLSYFEHEQQEIRSNNETKSIMSENSIKVKNNILDEYDDMKKFNNTNENIQFKKHTIYTKGCILPNKRGCLSPELTSKIEDKYSTKSNFNKRSQTISPRSRGSIIISEIKNSRQITKTSHFSDISKHKNKSKVTSKHTTF